MAKKRVKIVHPGRFIVACLLVVSLIGAAVFGVVKLAEAIAEPQTEESDLSFEEEESEVSEWRDESHAAIGLDDLEEQIQNIMEALSHRDEESESTETSYKYTLVILPGHGGEDPGNTAGENPEKEINLAVSLYIKQYIEDVTDDIRVLISRTTDEYISYEDQRAFADEAEPDFLLAVHCNSYSGDACGTEVEWMQNADATIQTRSQVAAQNLAKVTAEALKTKNRGAKLVVKGDGTALMKDFEAPAVIIELGFTSDEEEDDKLNNPVIQRSMGDAIGAQVIKLLYSYSPRHATE